MLTGRLVRVRNGRVWITPRYLDANDSRWVDLAGRLRETFQSLGGRTRGVLQQELRESFESDAEPIVVQGLAKLLEDRCDFSIVSNCSPEKLRYEVFSAAAAWRAARAIGASPIPARSAIARADILKQVGERLGVSPEQVDAGLFADLKSEQRLETFKDISAKALLERYNVAHAQAVLLRSTGVRLQVRDPAATRYRHLLRMAKFHRLVCDVSRIEDGECVFTFDGPLSLFTATQKYGLQLALFLPTVLLCEDFELEADLLWGPRRSPKKFRLTSGEGLVSHLTDHGGYVPPELKMFAELFRKQIADWELSEETRVLRLGDSFWVPDYCLRHRSSERQVFVEVLGFWRRSNIERHLERLRQFAKEPFILAVSEQLRVDEELLESVPADVYRFRQMPLPEEIIRLAHRAIHGTASC
jgi:predicted nuclease of restriction endonuclease-like RecB superfamily